MNFRGVLLSVTALLLAGSVRASDAVNQVSDTNVNLVVTVVGLGGTVPQLASGTNCHVQVKAELEGVAIPGPKWNVFYLTEVNAQIQGETVSQWTGTKADNERSRVLDITWASTHFAHDEEVEIKISAKAHLERWKSAPITPTNPTGQVLDQQKDLPTAEVTGEAKVYNIMSSLATVETFDSTSGYTIPSTMTADNFDAAADAGVEGALIQFASMKHHLVPSGKAAAKARNEPIALAEIPGATVYFAFTHGEQDGIRASRPDAGTLADEFLTWSEIFAANGPRTAPPMNMVFLYACRTVSSGNDVSTAFGITNGAAVIPDRALVGFGLWVNSLLKGSTDLLSEQSNALLNHLMDAETISNALNTVNTQFKAQGIGGAFLPLIPKGDGQARLVNVYYPNPADEALYKDKWFRVEVLA